ncbi:hypothetical protein RhiirC2_800350 [Rhizophagus irregularis]|uniref:SAM domain-containing protein n=1 Tax=Rhizophagus irregularis TaxID=588596 RepID=A0A2N1M3Q8_9GLOM|nr:hypothetical protein RhiirC2_800350 [Rhizophagus irregularis]
MSSMADILKGWETERLISFLWADSKSEGLELDDNFFTKLRDEKISGHLFLKLTGWEFKEYGMTLRQALELEDYIKELNIRKAELAVYHVKGEGSKSDDPPTS